VALANCTLRSFGILRLPECPVRRAKSGDVHPAVAVIHAINDSVGANDDLAKRGIPEFRNDPPQLREFGKPLGAVDQKLTNRSARSGESSEM
jgi:hypothetical protein